MKLLRWAALPVVLASLTLSSCSGQVTKAAVTPPPVAESPSPQADTFDAGLAKASDASYTTKTAETSEDWDFAVSRWQRAIELMQGVPKGSANYTQAQQKLVAYQRNLAAARSHTVPKEDVSEPVATAPEPESKPVASNTISGMSEEQKEQLLLLAVDSTASPASKAWGATISSEKKVAIAKGACTDFDHGATFTDIGIQILKSFGSNDAAGKYVAGIVGAGVPVYCPEHRSKLPSSH